MVREFSQNLLLSDGVYCSRVADGLAIKQLIRRVRPKEVGKSLVRLGGPGDGRYFLDCDRERLLTRA